MMDYLSELFVHSIAVFVALLQGDAMHLALKFVPFVLLLEIPLYILTWLGIIHYLMHRRYDTPKDMPYYPKVTCISNSYSEGRDVQKAVNSLLEQIYPGKIELLLVHDGSAINKQTYKAIADLLPKFNKYKNRSVRFIPKPQRGGRVSSTNMGLCYATGEIVIAMDGDTSFDNDMVNNAVKAFQDPNVVAATGPLRVRNSRKSLATRLQSIEYLIAIFLGKVGLSEWNLINNLPGAYMIYRKSILDQVGGWTTGTGEDLDLVIRVKQYFTRHPKMKMAFVPDAVGHTDVPDTMKDFFKQRLRWDGDLSYVYFRKHKLAFSPRLIGWRNFIAMIWYGMLFQIFLPFMLVGYFLYLIMFTHPAFFVGVMMLVLSFYFLLTFSQFLLFLALLSERPREDAGLIPAILVMPIFMVALRCWSVVATLHELFNKAHLQTTMGPRWVIERGGPR